MFCLKHLFQLCAAHCQHFWHTFCLGSTVFCCCFLVHLIFPRLSSLYVQWHVTTVLRTIWKMWWNCAWWCLDLTFWLASTYTGSVTWWVGPSTWLQPCAIRQLSSHLAFSKLNTCIIIFFYQSRKFYQFVLWPLFLFFFFLKLTEIWWGAKRACRPESQPSPDFSQKAPSTDS